MLGRSLTSLFSVVATVGALTFSSGANALVFDFSFVNTAGWKVSGNGQLVTADTGSPYQVLGITGTLFDARVPASPLTIVGLSDYAQASNQLIYPGPPFLTFEGISFITSDGKRFNLFTQDDGSQTSWYLEEFWAPEGYPDKFHPINLTVTAAVPELSSWAMIIFGFAGIGLLAYRRNGMAPQLA